jgi:hypothetical protein
MKTETQEKINTLENKVEQLQEENDLLWDMCNELRSSDIGNFPHILQQMITKTQEDAYYRAWIRKHVADNTGEAD